MQRLTIGEMFWEDFDYDQFNSAIGVSQGSVLTGIILLITKILLPQADSVTQLAVFDRPQPLPVACPSSCNRNQDNPCA